MKSTQCFACHRTACYSRIVTPDLQFDKLACPEHVRALELYADAALGAPGRRRATGHGERSGGR